jgi:hypothetical protein
MWNGAQVWCGTRPSLAEGLRRKYGGPGVDDGLLLRYFAGKTVTAMRAARTSGQPSVQDIR